MTPRLDYRAAAPDAFAAMMKLENFVQNCGLEKSLIELVKTRASQINGCAFCLHMHVKDARALGETEERLYLLSVWRESPLYSDRERAALAWTEALTRLPDTGAPDSDYQLVTEAFSPEEQVHLTLLIGVINSWNRIGVGFRLAHPVS